MEEFILHELELHEDNQKKFWKVIQKVVPAKKAAQSRDILLRIDKGSRCVLRCFSIFFYNPISICIVINESTMSRKC